MDFEAILFDCDGVLVDSEPITMGVLRDLLAESGWDMPLAECMAEFVGVTVRNKAALIESRTGRPLTDAWMADFYARRNAALSARLQPIPGAHAAVHAARDATAGRIACASGADRFKLELQLQMVGLAEPFGDAVFSGHELRRTKPAPDVYLATAQHLGAAPARCLVIEDSPTGVQAGAAAGAEVWAYCPDARGADRLRAAGATRLLRHMDELAQWLAP
ncbi:MAG TPA: HAD family phosphatase [Ottowia sp.]|uniref:HAD family hydrolase n=1 Tax=Ottowia sp. TaxID=1898956 RepID=UPI002C8DAFA3|nr:HAD family phosphatase [Ottowia sp.]HMN21760.1 HAD family phosphatase [Ottowia sp.]